MPKDLELDQYPLHAPRWENEFPSVCVSTIDRRVANKFEVITVADLNGRLSQSKSAPWRKARRVLSGLVAACKLCRGFGPLSIPSPTRRIPFPLEFLHP